MRRKIIRHILLLTTMIPLLCASAHAAHWNTVDGWVIRNNERFFPVGIWPTPDMSAREFADIDIIYLHNTKSYRPDMMKGKVLLIGSYSFQWVFAQGYDGSLAHYDANKDVSITYGEMQQLADANASRTIDYISRRVVKPWTAAIDTCANPDYCWFGIDEPDHYGFGRRTWCWPPRLTDRMNQAVKSSIPDNNLVIVSFGPPANGNVYFYDSRIPLINTPPKEPEFSDTYQRHYDNRESRKSSPETFIRNVRDTASAYCNSGDVMMLNDYNTFFKSPRYAGAAVDAFSAAADSLGISRPVWLWFNPGLIDRYSSYGPQRFMSQIYTAIAHGCTGIFFFCDNDTASYSHLSPSDWQVARDCSAELKHLEPILCSDMLDRGTLQEHNVHFALWQSDNGHITLLLSNSSNRKRTISKDEFPSDIIPLLPFRNTVTLEPYGYRFIPAGESP